MALKELLAQQVPGGTTHAVTVKTEAGNKIPITFRLTTAKEAKEIRDDVTRIAEAGRKGLKNPEAEAEAMESVFALQGRWLIELSPEIADDDDVQALRQITSDEEWGRVWSTGVMRCAGVHVPKGADSVDAESETFRDAGS